ncbi:MAG: hypothetical protein PHQ23_04015 [Candidatus Wallbacteria bacterium]|nr:hypothetical protein [Candidatus Wallbacteria bacterium]
MNSSDRRSNSAPSGGSDMALSRLRIASFLLAFLLFFCLGKQVFCRARYNSFDNILSGRNAMDLSLRSWVLALDEVDRIGSLKGCGNVGVYVMRTSDRSLTLQPEKSDSWTMLTTADRTGGSFGMRGNSAVTLEDLLINKLRASGFNVVETTGNYQEKWDLDENFVKTVGQKLDIDTLLIGSEMGSHIESYKFHTMFVDHYYLMAKHKVQLRSISTHTGLVRSTDVLEGAARVKTRRRLSVRGWDWPLLATVAYALSGHSRDSRVACLAFGAGMPLLESSLDEIF